MADHDGNLSWLQNFHSVNDSLDVSSLPKIYAKAAVLQFGNLDEVQGIDNIMKFFEHQFQYLDSMKHEIGRFDVVGDIIYQAAHISYLAKGDPEKRVITVPGFAVFHRVPPGGEDEGKTSRFDVYIDTSPLAQRMKEVAALAKE